MITLTNRDGVEIGVNPQAIKFVHPAGSGETTYVIFGDGDLGRGFIEVKEDVRDIINLCNASHICGYAEVE